MTRSPTIVGIRENPRECMPMHSIENLPPEGPYFIENDPGASPGVNRDEEGAALQSAFPEQSGLVARARS